MTFDPYGGLYGPGNVEPGDVFESIRDDVCDYAGHDWGDAGGGLLICVQCEAEKWDD